MKGKATLLSQILGSTSNGRAKWDLKVCTSLPPVWLALPRIDIRGIYTAAMSVHLVPICYATLPPVNPVILCDSRMRPVEIPTVEDFRTKGEEKWKSCMRDVHPLAPGRPHSKETRDHLHHSIGSLILSRLRILRQCLLGFKNRTAFKLCLSHWQAPAKKPLNTGPSGVDLLISPLPTLSCRQTFLSPLTSATTVLTFLTTSLGLLLRHLDSVPVLSSFRVSTLR